jgi:hypothetical protein
MHGILPNGQFEKELSCLATVSLDMIPRDEEGKLIKQIAFELGLSRSAVAVALEAGFGRRNEEPSDGRGRRSALANKHIEPP